MVICSFCSSVGATYPKVEACMSVSLALSQQLAHALVETGLEGDDLRRRRHVLLAHLRQQPVDQHQRAVERIGQLAALLAQLGEVQAGDLVGALDAGEVTTLLD